MNKGLVIMMVVLGIAIIGFMLYHAFGKATPKYHAPAYRGPSNQRLGTMSGINYPKSTVPLSIQEIYQANAWN